MNMVYTCGIDGFQHFSKHLHHIWEWKHAINFEVPWSFNLMKFLEMRSSHPWIHDYHSVLEDHLVFVILQVGRIIIASPLMDKRVHQVPARTAVFHAAYHPSKVSETEKRKNNKTKSGHCHKQINTLVQASHTTMHIYIIIYGCFQK